MSSSSKQSDEEIIERVEQALLRDDAISFPFDGGSLFAMHRRDVSAGALTMGTPITLNERGEVVPCRDGETAIGTVVGVFPEQVTIQCRR
jgi:hypothetical protein